MPEMNEHTYCPLSRMPDGSMMPCVSGCAWRSGTGCSVVRISENLRELKEASEELDADLGRFIDELATRVIR